MRLRSLRALALCALAAATLLPGGWDQPRTLAAAPPLDWEVPQGRYFTQAGEGQGGYTISDAGGIGLWSAFRRLGGVEVLGVPVSRRFELEGSIYQATQRALLRWDPEALSAVRAPVFDMLSRAGLDGWLAAEWGIPPAPAPDAMPAPRDGRLALLAPAPELQAYFLGTPDWADRYGMPVALETGESVVTLRAQNAVLQLWREDTPWAAAGQITLANAGDIAKAAGLVPPEARRPEPFPPVVLLGPASILVPGRPGEAAPRPAATAVRPPAPREDGAVPAGSVQPDGPPAVFLTGTRGLQLVGTLTNRHNRTVAVDVSAVFLDEDGGLVAKVGSSGNDLFLLPGESRPVTLATATRPAAWKEVRLQVERAVVVDGAPLQALAFIGRPRLVPGERLRVQAQVHNAGAAPVRPYALAIFYNTQGGILGAVPLSGPPVPAGHTATLAGTATYAIPTWAHVGLYLTRFTTPSGAAPPLTFADVRVAPLDRASEVRGVVVNTGDQPVTVALAATLLDADAGILAYGASSQRIALAPGERKLFTILTDARVEHFAALRLEPR